MEMWLPEEDGFSRIVTDLLGRETKRGLPSQDELTRARFTAAVAEDSDLRLRQGAELDEAVRWLALVSDEGTPLRLLADQVLGADTPLPEVREFAVSEFRLLLIGFWLWKGFDLKVAEEITQESILWFHTGRISSEEEGSMVEWAPPPKMADLGALDAPIARKALVVGLERYRDRKALDALTNEPEFKDGCRVLALRLWSPANETSDEKRRVESALLAAGRVVSHLHVVLRPRLESEAQGEGLSASAARRLAQHTILQLIGDVETVGFS
jgi:hypothetical protein